MREIIIDSENYNDSQLIVPLKQNWWFSNITNDIYVYIYIYIYIYNIIEYDCICIDHNYNYENMCSACRCALCRVLSGCSWLRWVRKGYVRVFECIAYRYILLCRQMAICCG